MPASHFFAGADRIAPLRNLLSETASGAQGAVPIFLS